MSKRSQMEPAHGPPLQARVAAANRTVLQLANCCNKRRSWRTWKEQGKTKQMNGGKNVEGSGHDMAKGGQAHSLQNKPLQVDTAGGLSARHRPQRNTGQQTAGLAAKQQLPTKLASLSPCSAGGWRECDGDGTQKAGSDLPTLSLPHLSPLPVTVPTHSLNL